MSGGKTSSVKVVLRNPLNFADQIDYTIQAHDNPLARDWVEALKSLIARRDMLEKNYCFMGFPKTARTVQYLCDQLNAAVKQINGFFGSEYHIADYFTLENVTTDVVPEGKLPGARYPNHDVLNVLHNHFERLQGTVWNLSDYYRRADYETKYAIRQLNNICHEMENLLLGQRHAITSPYWVRPSQITTFLNTKRYNLKDEHRELFVQNGYDRVLGGVYMHWTQIGKTLFEVFRDEGAPDLNIGDDPTDISVGAGATCEAINALKFYSGEFDVEWGNDVTLGGNRHWHNEEQAKFCIWLEKHGLDYQDPRLSLGYLPIGQVLLKESFGTEDYQEIWDMLSSHLDIYRIEVDGVSDTYDYCWSDPGYKQMQIDMMKPGYDYSSRRG